MADQQEKDSKRILWAPWRIKYVENCDKPTDCIFCEKPVEDKDQENLIVYRGEHNFIIMNKYPYNNGHLMIVPYTHTCDLSALDQATKAEWIDLIELSQKVLAESMAPHGFNVGMNMGRVAGAGIAEHLHFHIVPRWNGDTNFMPVLGNAKIVSEGLEDTWEKLNNIFMKYS